MMRKPFMLSTVLGALVVFVPIALAYAGAEDNLNERVSAASCQPRQSSDRDKLAWSGTDWVFATGVEATVVLECPVFTDGYDDTTGQREIEEVRLWYRDSDGTGTDARVQAELRYTDPSFSSMTSQLVANVDSNNSSTTTQTQRAVSVGGDLMLEAQYFVVVTMTRNDDAETVVFRGVSFYQDPS